MDLPAEWFTPEVNELYARVIERTARHLDQFKTGEPYEQDMVNTRARLVGWVIEEPDRLDEEWL